MTTTLTPRITLVRHTSVDVEPGICYGQTDVGLRASFPEEAAATRAVLRRIAADTGSDFDAVFRSPLSRCRRLADACGYPDAVPDSRLLELDFGEWEMRRYDDIRDPRLQEWYSDWLHVAPTGGESFMDQQRRVRDFLEAARRSGRRHTLVFTHAGVIMNALLLTRQADLRTLFSRQPAYGEAISLILPASLASAQ
ncbi:MAG: alpha-ribazole phosphatase [Bacteroides sp.]|nr:alpha-ribazole phosphatase [Bacteroides sp.]